MLPAPCKPSSFSSKRMFYFLVTGLSHNSSPGSHSSSHSPQLLAAPLDCLGHKNLFFAVCGSFVSSKRLPTPPSLTPPSDDCRINPKFGVLEYISLTLSLIFCEIRLFHHRARANSMLPCMAVMADTRLSRQYMECV